MNVQVPALLHQHKITRVHDNSGQGKSLPHSLALWVGRGVDPGTIVLGAKPSSLVYPLT